jgi:hypothetical protein
MLPWAYIVAAGYIEPVMIAAAAAFMYADARRSRAAAAISFMLLPGLKQYVVAPVLSFAAMRGVRAAAAGAAVAIALAAPIVIWNPAATLAGLMAIPRQMGNPAAFRSDSISATAEVARLFGVKAGPWLGPAAQLAAAAAAFELLPDRRGTGGLLFVSGLSLVASFLLGTQAFVNYYAFAAALLMLATLAFAGSEAAA